ncbi:MAG: class I SAM-dependent RNA methyltransferase [Myxococcales bacterium]|nr:class I SAM-dependent RNA methyltransferase [Myxococcales bacterium]
MKPGDTITVMAETLSRHGDGVARHDGYENHVGGLLPGETGDVELDYVSKQRPRAHGATLRRRNTHPGRRPAPCPHHGRCNGCPLMEMDLPSQHTLKREELEREYGLEVDRLVPPEGGGLRYRWSAKRVVHGVPGRLVLGSYMRGTHNVADMAGCLVDHPDIVRCAQELVARANALRVEPYDELSEHGDLRYVWFKTDGRGQVLLTLITAEPRSPSIYALAEQLTVPVGIAWGINSTRGNDLRGTSLRPIRGRQSLTLDIAGVEFHCGPLGFLQPNPSAIAHAYHDLVHVPAGGSPHGRVALDLYAGTGVTTALLRTRFAEVLPCESYPESARQLGVEPQLVEEFLAKILALPYGSARHPDLVVANPPRGGLGPTVCTQLNELHASRLHLMSCNPRSLRDDLTRLTGPEGKYRLIQARAFDTLPQTAHIEIVAWLVGK